MSDYDAWLTNCEDEQLFCPSCLQPITDWNYYPDELVTVGTCDCGWDGTDGQALQSWEVEADIKADRADMLNDLRKEGLL